MRVSLRDLVRNNRPSGEGGLLLQDALALECDAFLTMEKKLTRNAEHIEAAVGLRLRSTTPEAVNT